MQSIFFPIFAPIYSETLFFLRILCPDIKISKWLCSKPKHTEYASQAIFWTKYQIKIIFKHFLPLFFSKYMVRLIFPIDFSLKLSELEHFENFAFCV